jgi:hypothetical protein
MKTFATLVASAMLALPAAAQSLDIKLVKPFHILERSLTLVTHRGQIVAGRTGTEDEGASFVESYDPVSFKMQSSVSVPHGIRRLKVIDSCKVFATGTDQFSVVNYCTGGAPTRVTRATPSGMIAHEGTALTASDFAFIEPNEGLIRVTLSGSERRLGDNISYTRSLDFWNGSLWAANYFNVWKINPATGDRQRVLATDSEIYGLKYTTFYHPEGYAPMIVASARDDHKLLFIDAENGTVAGEFRTKGEPAGMATFGQCLVTVLSDNKQVYFLKMENGEPKFVDSWDALGAGDMLKQPTEIAVSESLKTVYLRSSYPCPTCTNTQSALFALRQIESTTFEKCM